MKRSICSTAGFSKIKSKSMTQKEFFRQYDSNQNKTRNKLSKIETLPMRVMALSGRTSPKFDMLKTYAFQFNSYLSSSLQNYQKKTDTKSLFSVNHEKVDSIDEYYVGSNIKFTKLQSKKICVNPPSTDCDIQDSISSQETHYRVLSH